MANFALPVDDNDITILGIMASLELAAANEFSEFLELRLGLKGSQTGLRIFVTIEDQLTPHSIT